jgi:medium-chain acyl-[acyl-carrier-protein] hydrolase
MLAVHKETSPWLMYRKPNPKVRLRLFCFPYAGGGALVYRNWAKDLPGTIELCPLQPPGRETRLREEPFTDLGLLVQSLASTLRPFLDRPFAFFGHSLGALVSYQLAHYLRSRDGTEPAHLFVSGRKAPHLTREKLGISKLPEPQFIERVKELGGTAPAVFQDRELMQLILPALRADFHLCDTYQFRSEATLLRCPITALGGLQDKGVAWQDLEAWRKHTSGRFRTYCLPGNHFFINTSKSTLLELMRQELQGLVNSLDK